MNAIYVRFAVCIVLCTSVISCSSTVSRIRDARDLLCPSLLEEHTSLSKAADYESVPAITREEYEVRVARCLLGAGKAAEALALATTWQENNEADRLKISARALATLNRLGEAQQALEDFASLRPSDPSFFVVYDEFAGVRSEPWFIAAAMLAAVSIPDIRLDQFADRLMARASLNTVALRMAVGDTSPRQEDWATWMGTVHEGSVEQPGGRLSLVAEGIDVETAESSRDRVESLEARPARPDSLRNWTVVPKYSTETSIQESFVANGKQFVIRTKVTSEALERARYVFVVGPCVGRDSEGRPIVEAVFVAPREPRTKTTVTGRTAAQR